MEHEDGEKKERIQSNSDSMLNNSNNSYSTFSGSRDKISEMQKKCENFFIQFLVQFSSFFLLSLRFDFSSQFICWLVLFYSLGLNVKK